MSIGLPNNLVGYVSALHISQQFRQRLETSSDSDNEDDVPSLKELFEIDQWLRVAVLTVSRGQVVAGKKEKKSIELSVEPSEVNKGLSDAHIQTKGMIQASVKSVEDHGVVMDLGLDSDTGFVKNKELGRYSDRTLQVGQVCLCHVKNDSNKVLQLSLDLATSPEKLVLKALLNIDAVLPGDGVSVVVEHVNSMSFSGKIGNLLDATCDSFHSNLAIERSSIVEGQKLTARVIFVDRENGTKKVGVSLLPHIVQFTTLSASDDRHQNPTDALPVGFKLQVIVKRVEPTYGLFCDIGIKGISGFAHISRITEDKIDSLDPTDGAYKLGSSHPARIIGYNPVDGIFLLSLEQKILDAPFLSVADIKIGEHATGTVEKFIEGGMLVKISEGVVAMASEIHMANVVLQFPEKKFKIGSVVKSRILSTDLERNRVTLTLKKALVNSDQPILSSYDDAVAGSKTQYVGVIMKLHDNGALIQFYGGTNAWLPSSEMSEAYIAEPKEHFHVGQTLNVRVLSVDPANRKMTVSCRDPALWDEQKEKLDEISIGSLVSANVSTKTKDKLILSLVPGDFVATLDLAQLADDSLENCEKAFKKTKMGAVLKDLVVLDKQARQQHIILSKKPSLIKAAQAGNLVSKFEDLQVGRKLSGFVRATLDYGILIGFGGDLTGLALKHNLSNEHVASPQTMFQPLQSIECQVLDIDKEAGKFQLTLKTTSTQSNNIAEGSIVSAVIASIKDTQINLRINTGDKPLQGRLDASAIFDNLAKIKNQKSPLKQFTVGSTIDVRIVGQHNAKSHRFLPISHTGGGNTVLECAVRPILEDYAHMKIGSEQTAFVTNISGDSVWVNISPLVRGRISLLELKTPDTKQYPLGSALKCTVISCDEANNLILSERHSEPVVADINSLKLDSVHDVLITRVTESGLYAQISPTLAGRISLTDISGDFEEVPVKNFKRNQIVKATVKSIDIPNKRVLLSLRSSEGKDPEINSVSDLKVGQKCRGYIKNVADHGLFVELGRTVVGRVKITNVSDAFIKDWKAGFQVDQLVSGTVIAIDQENKRVEFSLKKGAAEGADSLASMSDGQIVEGSIRKIEAYGVYVNIKGTNLSGLCHVSEIADKQVKDISSIYSIGDIVKAKILSINREKRRIALGLKSSYFRDEEEEEDEEMAFEEEGEDDIVSLESEEEEEEGLSLDGDAVAERESEAEDEEESDAEGPAFDWTADSVFAPIEEVESESELEPEIKPKKKTKKSYDDTPIEAKAPESVPDFERLILGNPDSSAVWIQFMAFHMQSSDLTKAREVAERALKTINYRQEAEKLNVWMAYLNLENNFGTPESLDAVFKRSCEYNEPREMYSRLVGTYIRSGKTKEADATYAKMLKKFSQNPKVWVEYATWLAGHDLDKSRDLLPRALSTLPKSEHISIVQKFGQLEFRKGDPERGRTLFEGLLSNYPKRLDIWNVLIDMESTHKNMPAIRQLFNRILATKLSQSKAKSVFKKWLKLEKENGTEDDQSVVTARAQEYVKTHF